MSFDKPIGGFFDFEVFGNRNFYHSNALGLTNGRACLSYVIDNEEIESVYVPLYSCNTLLEPFKKRNINIKFYNIDNQLNPIYNPKLNENEFYILINYFGLKEKLINELIEKFGRQLIIDDTHNFFGKGYGKIYSFTSARKYFGVPDGAYLYGSQNAEINNIPRFTRISLQHNILRLEGRQEDAFKSYQEYENSLGTEVLRISKTSETILASIDYEAIMNHRKMNFDVLYDHFQSDNLLHFTRTNIDVPFCYPLLLKNEIDKKLLYAKQIFIPTLWPDILERENRLNYPIEERITRNLLPLPVDHRYDINDMHRLIKVIKAILR